MGLCCVGLLLVCRAWPHLQPPLLLHTPTHRARAHNTHTHTHTHTLPSTDGVRAVLYRQAGPPCGPREGRGRGRHCGLLHTQGVCWGVCLCVGGEGAARGNIGVRMRARLSMGACLWLVGGVEVHVCQQVCYRKVAKVCRAVVGPTRLRCDGQRVLPLPSPLLNPAVQCENVECIAPHSVRFDFLGKDSIRWVGGWPWWARPEGWAQGHGRPAAREVVAGPHSVDRTLWPALAARGSAVAAAAPLPQTHSPPHQCVHTHTHFLALPLSHNPRTHTQLCIMVSTLPSFRLCYSIMP